MSFLIPFYVVAFFALSSLSGTEANQQRSPSSIYMQTLLGQKRHFLESSLQLEQNRNLLQGEHPILTALLEKHDDLIALLGSLATESDLQCLMDMAVIVQSAFPAKQTWALKYIDAWAKPGAGIMLGAYSWFGDFDECIAIEPFPTSQNTTIRPQYCHVGLTPTSIIASMNMTAHDPSLMQFNVALTVGLCVPTTCTEETLNKIVSGLVPTSTGLRLNPTSTHCQSIDPPLTKYTWAGIGVCSFIGVFILIGFAVDLVIRFRNWLTAWQIATQNESDVDPLVAPLTRNEQQINGDGHGSNGIERPTFPAEQIGQMIVKTPLPSLSKVTRLLLVFSPYTNFGKVFTLPYHSVSTPNLNAMHAIRALSLLWVLLGHSYLFGLSGSLDNFWTTLEWPKRFTYQFVMSAIFAVDTFFFLSGFFAYWSLARKYNTAMTSEGSKKNRFWFWKSLPFVYLNRFVRIASPYMAIIMIDVCLWANLSNGPMYFQDIDMTCVKHWWTNLLFVQNLVYGMSDTCIGWAWYLAIDMQLFLLAPFIVALFVWSPRDGWAAAVLALVGQATYCASVTFSKHLPSALFIPPGENRTLQIPGQPGDLTNYTDWIYTMPHARLAPYVIGIVIGHLVVKHSAFINRNLFSRRLIAFVCWLVCFATMFTVIYGQFGPNAGRYTNQRWVDALYNAFARTAWGLALGWLTLALVLNRAGPIGRGLSWPGWALPAKLSYAAYLVNPLVLIFYTQTSRRPFYATDMTMIFYFCGSTVATFIVATLFSLAFESPIVGLQRLFLGSSASM